MGIDWDVARDRAGWWLLGAAILVVVASALLGLVGALGFAVFLYYATRPAYRRLESRFEHPDVTATLTLSLVGVPIVIVLAYGAVVGANAVTTFLESTEVGQFEPLLEPYVSVAADTDLLAFARTLVSDPQRVAVADAPALARDYLGPVLTYLGEIFSALVRVFILVTVAFYLLRDDQKIGAWLRRSFDHDPTFVAYVDAVDRDLETVFYGNLVTIAVTGVIAVAVYHALNLVVPVGQGIARPILLGMLTGVSVLVPAVGMKLVYVPYTLVLAVRAAAGGTPWWFVVAFFAATFVVVDTIPDFYIRSYLSAGDDLNMGMILLAYVIGTVAFGWIGLFVGPIVLVVAYQFAVQVFPALVTGRPVR